MRRNSKNYPYVNSVVNYSRKPKEPIRAEDVNAVAWGPERIVSNNLTVVSQNEQLSDGVMASNEKWSDYSI